MTALSAQTVANQFIALAKGRGKKLTPMQVLKLVYLAHGWNLAYTGEPLIKEKIEAWMYGPVIRSLYETVRAYGAAPVSNPLPAPLDESPSDKQRDMIERVYNTYEDLNGIQLSNLTHLPNTPWSKVYNEGAGAFDIIPDARIQEFYKKKLQAGS